MILRITIHYSIPTHD